MALSLTDANGRPVSSFGSGNSSYATGSPSGGGMFSNFQTFGDTTDTNVGAITPTTAGSTFGLGYKDLSAGHGSTRGGGGAKAAVGGNGIQLTPGEPIGIEAPKVPDPEPNKPNKESTPDTYQDTDGDIINGGSSTGTEGSGSVGQTQNGNFGAGASTSRPGGDMPGRLAISSSSSNGGTSDAEAADINARAGI